MKENCIQMLTYMNISQSYSVPGLSHRYENAVPPLFLRYLFAICPLFVRYNSGAIAKSLWGHFGLIAISHPWMSRQENHNLHFISEFSPFFSKSPKYSIGVFWRKGSL